MKILINNEEVVCSNQLIIKEEMLSTSSTILNNCYPKSWEETKDYVSNYYYPKDYSKCLIYDDDNNLIFAGVVKRTGNISLNPSHFHGCNLQILDFKDFLSTGETLDYVISGKTVLEAIKMVIATVSDYGVVLGNVNILGEDDIIGAYSTLDKTAYDVFQYLADISQSRWTTRLVDENTIAVDFYDPSLMPEGDTLEYTEEWFCENNLVDMTYNYSTNDYRNKQTIKSQEIYADIDYIQSVFTDGYNTTYPLESNIAKIVSITLNGETLSFATSTEKEFGATADIYYTAGENTITTDTTYIAGSELIVTYTPIIKGRQTLYNDDEISRIESQTNRKGVISRYEERNDVVSSAELIAIGETYLKYKGIAEINLTVTLKDNNLWNVGEVVEVTDVPITELNTKYMVKTKTIENNIVAGSIFYTYVLTNSYNSETAINYFDNQRAKALGNLEVGDFIDRNIDIINSALILFTDATVESVTVTGDNALNSVLNSPFNI